MDYLSYNVAVNLKQIRQSKGHESRRGCGADWSQQKYACSD